MSAVLEEPHPTGAVETIVEPQSVEEIADLVRKCESDKISLAPVGAARTLSQIRRAPVRIGISLRRMANIVAYEPEDMTVVAQAGLTVGNLNATLATPGQRLPVDPRGPDATTLGSLIAAAHAGPLRLSEGTVRDLLIGIQYVGHGGRIVRAGGRVVKNVAGYDLMKVMTGSFGTLGIVTEATFKVRPIPENYTLAVAAFPDADAAFAAASKLHDQVPLIHLEVTSRAASAAIGTSVRFLVLAGFGGIRSELNYLSERVAKALGPDVELLEGQHAMRTLFRVARSQLRRRRYRRAYRGAAEPARAMRSRVVGASSSRMSVQESRSCGRRPRIRTSSRNGASWRIPRAAICASSRRPRRFGSRSNSSIAPIPAHSS